MSGVRRARANGRPVPVGARPLRRVLDDPLIPLASVDAPSAFKLVGCQCQFPRSEGAGGFGGPPGVWLSSGALSTHCDTRSLTPQ
jgi:hypothetical protein